MNRYALVLICSISIVLFGCATQVTYGGRQYASPNEALSVHRGYLQESESAIEPLAEPVAERLRIVLVDRSDVASKLIRNPQNTTREGIDYLVEVSYSDMRTVANSIQKRKIYKYSSIEFGTGEHLEASESSDVFYYFVIPNRGTQWYFVSRKLGRVPVSFDNGIVDRGARMRAFVDNVHSLALVR